MKTIAQGITRDGQTDRQVKELVLYFDNELAENK